MRRPRAEDAHAALIPQHRPPHQRNTGQLGGIGNQIFSLKGIGTIDDHRRVLLGEQIKNPGCLQVPPIHRHRERWGDLAGTMRGNLSLRPATIGGTEQRLALQIRQLNHIVIDERNRPDPGGSERLHHRAAQAARADNEHTRIGNRLLVETRQTILPRYALSFESLRLHEVLWC